MTKQKPPICRKCKVDQCQNYGPIGGFSVQCVNCNKIQSEKRRADSKKRRDAKKFMQDIASCITFDGVKQPHGTEADVCQDITKRQELGLKKYGVSIRKNNLNLKQWLTHAYQECLDQAIYLKRAIEEIEKRENKK